MKNLKLIGILAFLLLGSCSSGSSPGMGALPKSVSAVDETSAIQTLRTIATAQAQARGTRGSYADFNTLVQAGLLDPRFSGDAPTLRGYRFTMTAAENDFSVNADPQPSQAPETVGGRHFYLDAAENVVRVNATQRASKNDPAL